MTVQKKIKIKQKLLDVKNYFKELTFQNAYIEKPKIKRLKNIPLLSELTFYRELSVIKANKAFTGYAMTYKVKLFDKKVLYHNQKQVNQALKTCLMIFQMK